MSIKSLQPADSQQEIREQLRAVTDFHEKSAQAVGDLEGNRHVDGQNIYQRFGIPPFYKYIARAERHGKNVAEYPSALVAPLLHVTNREIEVLREIDVEFDPSTRAVSHEVLEEIWPQRAKLLE